MSWVLAQLSNADVVTFMKKAKANLNEGGVIVLKENVNDEEKVLIDWEDHSVFRPTSVYSKLFKMAGLKILVEEDMPWPENMYGMRAYALG